jgi:hypothetical protein
MTWQDIVIGYAVNTLISVIRDPKGRGKWRKALLKIFAEIARAFRDDAEFAAAVSEGKP